MFDCSSRGAIVPSNPSILVVITPSQVFMVLVKLTFSKQILAIVGKAGDSRGAEISMLGCASCELFVGISDVSNTGVLGY